MVWNAMLGHRARAEHHRAAPPTAHQRLHSGTQHKKAATEGQGRARGVSRVRGQGAGHRVRGQGAGHRVRGQGRAFCGCSRDWWSALGTRLEHFREQPKNEIGVRQAGMRWPTCAG